MKHIKHELQHIICGDGQIGEASQLKKTQNFLRRNAPAGGTAEQKQYLKAEEEIQLISFLKKEQLLIEKPVSENDFIASGAE